MLQTYRIESIATLKAPNRLNIGRESSFANLGNDHRFISKGYISVRDFLGKPKVKP